MTGENHQLLRIFMGESESYQHQPVWEHLIHQAHKNGLAGCTVLKGVAGFGATRHIHTTGILDLSSDLPVVVEIVDSEEKISGFLKIVDDLFSHAGCGGLVTVEKATVKVYQAGKK